MDDLSTASKPLAQVVDNLATAAKAAEPPVRDVTRSAGDPSAAAGYYQPLLAFLSRQPGPPFRIEIPFTGFHWEAYAVAPRFPRARGWERQLDIKDNHLFFSVPKQVALVNESNALTLHFIL